MDWSSFQTKLITGTVVLLVSGATAWAGWMTNKVDEIQNRLSALVSEDRVRMIVDKDSPYKRDEPLLKFQLESINKKLESIDKKIEAIDGVTRK